MLRRLKAVRAEIKAVQRDEDSDVVKREKRLIRQPRRKAKR
jgi:hypothetical protein